jgi:hypothetical protein
MARTTPAQKPLGCARTTFMPLLSLLAPGSRSLLEVLGVYSKQRLRNRERKVQLCLFPRIMIRWRRNKKRR